MYQQLHPNFYVKLTGDFDQLNVETLAHSLVCIADLVRFVNQDLSPGVGVINITTTITHKDSIWIEFTVVTDTLQNLLTKENIATCASIITTLSGIFALRKFIKSDKPKRTESNGQDVRVIRSDTNQINVNNTIFNIYSQNKNLNRRLNDLFDGLNQNQDVKALEIYDSTQKKLVEVERTDFAKMSAGKYKIKTKTNLKNARVLWIEAGYLSGGSRSQIEFPVDFGDFFSINNTHEDVAVQLIYMDKTFPAKRMEFHNNSVWRLNLPTKRDGLGSRGFYDGMIFVFEKTSQNNVFLLWLTKPDTTIHAQLRAETHESNHGYLKRRTGELREYGYW